MSLSWSVFAALMVGFGIYALVLRRTRQQNRDGLAEHAGKEIDKAVAKAEQRIEKASRRIQTAAKDARK